MMPSGSFNTASSFSSIEQIVGLVGFTHNEKQQSVNKAGLYYDNGPVIVLIDTNWKR